MLLLLELTEVGLEVVVREELIMRLPMELAVLAVVVMQTLVREG
jgi:hypothetical protein